MHWYAVSTKPNQEKQVERLFTGSGMECFLPLINEQKIVRRIRKTVITPLFPGYLFVRIDLARQYRTVTYARGVRRLVGFGSQPVEVDVEVIDVIKSRATNDHRTEMRNDLKHGQRVQIQHGPLGGLEAVFIQTMPGRQRATVLLHALAFRARAVVSIDQLSPFEAA